MFHKLGCQRFLTLGLAVGGALATATAGCDTGGDDDGFTGIEWKRIREMSTNPMDNPVPPNPVNKLADSPAVIKLGQMLFFEIDHAEALTADNANGKKGETGKVGCATCHNPAQGWVRSEATTAGLGAPGRRNVPNMINVAWAQWAGWTGRHDSLVPHGTGVMGTSATRLALAHYFYRKYRNEWNEAFGYMLPSALDPMDPEAARFPVTGNPKANDAAPDGAWEKMTVEDQHFLDVLAYDTGRIWEAYPRALITRNSAFQRYIDGDRASMTAEAKRGLKLFIGKAACNDCHSGPGLSDSKAHNIGVPSPPAIPGAMPAAPDMGRFADLQATLTHKFRGDSEFSDDREFGRMKLQTAPKLDDMTMQGAFKTPVIQHVEKTGPYFHTGLVNTLEEVVQHYNKGGGEIGSFPGTKDIRLKPLMLSDEEVGDLVAFLKSLTGQLPPDLTADIAKH